MSMSAMQDFKKAWGDKFGAELPSSSFWIEDVRTNLAKHKARVDTLRKSLKEEEEHVKFLESLLEEIENSNFNHGATSLEKSCGQAADINQVIQDTLQRRTQNANASSSNKEPEKENVRNGNGEALPETKEEPEVPTTPSSEQGNSEEHFVTVIEVNGLEKEKRQQAQRNGGPPPSSGESEKERKKPVPPIPPPKNLRRSVLPDIPTPPISRPSFSSFGHKKDKEAVKEDPKDDRNVVFDSRLKEGRNKNSDSIGSSSSGSSTNEGVFKPAQKKKFEGSKLPLPPKDQPQQPQLPRRAAAPTSLDLSKPSPSPERRNSSRTKISDMIGKFQQPKEEEKEVLPKRSFRRSSQCPSNSYGGKGDSDTQLGDYMDPHDAEGLLVGSEEIYDLPPESPSSPIVEDVPGEKEPVVNPNNGDGLELEPMYDTVAPDAEHDDDYVVLMEEEGAAKSVGTGSSSNANVNNFSHAQQKRRESQPEGKADSATIRSQTSILSGQSINTTSSGTTSDTEGFNDSPVPNEYQNERTPSTNYVNLDYFLGRKSSKTEQYVSESEQDSDTESLLHRAISTDRSSDFKGADDDSRSSKESVRASEEAPTMRVADQVKLKSYQSRVGSIAASENQYVEVLNLMLHYMKAMKGTFSYTKPVLSTDDFNVIFYKIPELHSMHQKFLFGLQEEVSKSKYEVGKHFETLAKEVDVYGSFLQNYSRAVDTVKKCSQNNAAFAETTRDIRSRPLNINAGVTLETLLHSPVSRVQKNLEIVVDLLKKLPDGHPDCVSLANAQKLFQSFLTEFKMIQPEQLSEKNVRKLVKNSFIVELSEGVRKLRHLFLFNDVLVCAKYKASGKKEKFTYELKWHMPVADCLVVENMEQKESAPINLVSLRSRASNVRDQIKRQSSRDDKTKAEKNRKKLAELESQLVLASPNLILKLKSSNGKSQGNFFLSSEYDRCQWIETIETLKKQSALLPATPQLSSNELQQWITKNRKDLKTNMYMGSYLLRTGKDENLLVGDFYIMIGQLAGIQRPADLFICLEVDSYGHFFRKAKTKMICGSSQPSWKEDFVIELEGALNLRVLLYEEHPSQGQLIRAATTVELNRSWVNGSLVKPIEKTISLQDYTLSVSTRFTPSEMTIRRVPTSKSGALFGAKITQVCKREKRQVPFIITSCVKEIERRGINEQGIYRVSGSASESTRLKKAFETNCYEAEQLLKEVDINSVASLLKTYLRELPEALFTDELYPRFFEAFSLGDEEMKAAGLLQTFDLLPPLNQHIIMYLLDHMNRINQHETHNKMSINNLATVFGPTLLRPGGKQTGNVSIDLLAAGTANCIAQTGILYFFLWRRANQEPLSTSL